MTPIQPAPMSMHMIEQTPNNKHALPIKLIRLIRLIRLINHIMVHTHDTHSVASAPQMPIRNKQR